MTYNTICRDKNDRTRKCMLEKTQMSDIKINKRMLVGARLVRFRPLKEKLVLMDYASNTHNLQKMTDSFFVCVKLYDRLGFVEWR